MENLVLLSKYLIKLFSDNQARAASSYYAENLDIKLGLWGDNEEYFFF
ncbi:MAG: hypothetical protein WCP85_30540 [Mariniphaga sp.]